MKIRNAIHTAYGSIDCEIEHPVYGWIPFTASPDDAEEHGRQIYADLVAQGNIAAAVSPPVPTETELLQKEREGMRVSRFQARAALHQAGLLSQVEAIMADPATDTLVKLAWQDAQEFVRFSPTIQTVAGLLGITDAELDGLFRLAASIHA
jgi:hypothetical protein